LLHEILSGQPLRSVSVKELRIGLVRDPFWLGIESEVERAIAAAVDAMRRLTREVQEVTPPVLPTAPGSPLPATYSTVIFAEAHAFHREMLEQHPDRYHSWTRATIELGRSIPAAQYILARREMERLRATAGEHLLRNVDVLITPTAPGVAFKLGSDRDLVFLRNTAPWNLYGLPTISIPCGFSKGGLPIGLQITGARDRDDTVFSLAAAFQAETDFHQRRPRS
jgi:aspartyl-tRNA(Asn)/glutamyl-tRNA(Gln) amidotransferase subunit A